MFASPEVIFVLGHMRAGTTLLLHLLINHRQVFGEGELNRSYSSLAEIRRQYWKFRIKRGDLVRPYRYYVEQINHDDITPDVELLNTSRVRVVFLIREPASYFGSLQALSDSYYGGSWTPTKIVDYYCRRLELLTKRARYLDDSKAMSITYEDLTREPEQVLAALTRFLGLRKPLEPSYAIRDFTGRRGDPTEKIFAGRVLENSASGAAMDPRDSELLREAYANAIAGLGQLSWTRFG